MADAEDAYDFVALDAAGRRIKGSVQALNAAQAFSKLARPDLTIVRLTRAGSSSQKHAAGTARADQIALLRQLAMMVGARVELMQALGAMQAGARNPVQRKAIEIAMVELRSGKPLGLCLSMAIPGLPSNILALINAGEASGCLAETLGHAVEQLEAEQRIAQTIKSAMIYPAFLSTAGMIAGMIMLLFVIPRFATLIGDRRDELDPMSRAIFWLGDLAQQDFALGLIVPILSFIAACAYGLRDRNAFLRRMAVRHIPIFARLSLERERERWCRIMAFALLARIAIVDAFNLAAAGIGDPQSRNRALEAARDLRIGAGVAAATAATGLLDETQLSLIRTGEESGMLAEMFRRVAIDSEESLKESVKRSTTLLEQAVVVAVSVFVGLIVYGLISSLTSVYETIGL